MTVFDKKLNIWIIDDLANRRDSHEEIIRQEIDEVTIFKIAHPAHLERVLEDKLEIIKDQYNLFFSDFNMQWFNVEWTDDLILIEGLQKNDSLNDFYGTQKVLEKYKDKIANFLLVMCSTLVIEEGYAVTRNSFGEHPDKSWEYEDLPLATTEISKIHKLSKPFNKKRFLQAIQHYQHLIKSLTK